MQPENEYVVYTDDEHVIQTSLDFCRHFAGIKTNIACISLEIPNLNTTPKMLGAFYMVGGGWTSVMYEWIKRYYSSSSTTHKRKAVEKNMTDIQCRRLAENRRNSAGSKYKCRLSMAQRQEQMGHGNNIQYARSYI